MKPRLIALAAGGTGGHLFPAQALAEELQRRGRGVLLATDERGARFAADFPADERFLLSAASPSIGGPMAKAAAAMSIAGALMTAIGEFRGRRIAAAVGFGGYPTFPAMKAASLLGVPYGIHEQNGVLGRANRLIANGAAFVAHGFPRLDKVPAKARARLVESGNPVRGAVREAAHHPFAAPVEEAPLRLLIFGGSQGAALFSSVAPKAVAALPESLRARLLVTQQARESEVDSVRRAYEGAGVNCEIAPFFSDLAARMARAHLVLARAGASTITELSAIGRPSILVPLAIAMDDHQTGNARVMSDAGAAVVIAESEFSPERLSAALHDLLADAKLLGHMAQAAKGRVKEGASGALADLVERIASEKARAAA